MTPNETRDAVIRYMHYDGEDFWRLTYDQWNACYILADGFGKISSAWAAEQSYDWSHVRDSSSQAFDRMWRFICRAHNEGRLNPQREAIAATA